MKSLFFVAAIAILSRSAYAVDGQVLINQSTVMAAGGFPYSIPQSGSYKLSGNLVVPAGVGAIVIAASNVTLDLNGFSIQGPAQTCSAFPCDPTWGITVQSSPAQHENVTIRNGSIVGFAGRISLTTVTYLLAEKLILISPQAATCLQLKASVHRRWCET